MHFKSNRRPNKEIFLKTLVANCNQRKSQKIKKEEEGRMKLEEKFEMRAIISQGRRSKGRRKKHWRGSRATFKEEAVGKKEDDAEGVFYLGRFVLSAPFKPSRMMSFPLFVFIW